MEVGAGLGQGVLEWVGAGGRAVAVELLESNAALLRVCSAAPPRLLPLLTSLSRSRSLSLLRKRAPTHSLSHTLAHTHSLSHTLALSHSLSCVRYSKGQLGSPALNLATTA